MLEVLVQILNLHTDRVTATHYYSGLAIYEIASVLSSERIHQPLLQNGLYKTSKHQITEVLALPMIDEILIPPMTDTDLDKFLRLLEVHEDRGTGSLADQAMSLFQLNRKPTRADLQILMLKSFTLYINDFLDEIPKGKKTIISTAAGFPLNNICQAAIVDVINSPLYFEFFESTYEQLYEQTFNRPLLKMTSSRRNARIDEIVRAFAYSSEYIQNLHSFFAQNLHIAIGAIQQLRQKGTIQSEYYWKEELIAEVKCQMATLYGIRQAAISHHDIPFLMKLQKLLDHIEPLFKDISGGIEITIQ